MAGTRLDHITFNEAMTVIQSSTSRQAHEIAVLRGILCQLLFATERMIGCGGGDDGLDAAPEPVQQAIATTRRHLGEFACSMRLADQHHATI